MHFVRTVFATGLAAVAGLLAVAASAAGEEIDKNYQLGRPAAGDLRFAWIHGSRCAATNRDPRIQVIQYNEDTYMMRENPAVAWEAPFTYLLMGNQRALLIDTGATAEAKYYPLRETVEKVLRRWADIRGKKVPPLTVVLTSAEDIAQNQGYQQFVGRPDTLLAPLQLNEAKAFYKLGSSWPEGTGTIDLGGRIVTVIPTPGTHKDGLTFYDSYNGLLHTGDFVLPGRILIANDRDYLASIARLKTFAASHPLKWIMGGHIEMMFLPGKEYPRFRTYKPYEHVLQLEPAVLEEAANTATGLFGKAGVVIRAEFILLNRVGPDERAKMFPSDLPNIQPHNLR